jgi:hypothetical protein
LEFLTSSILSEVNSYFSISHKVDLKIREELNENIVPYVKLTSKEKEMEFINLIISTKKTILDIEVKGPDFNRKEKIINWGLWLPYRDLVEYSDQRKPYIKFYFDALVILFERYGVEEVVLRQVQKAIEKEVIENKEYEYEEENDIEVDLSDLDID